EHPWWSAGRLRVLLEEVRRHVLDQLARHGGRRLHVHAVRALLDGEHGHLLLVVAFGSLPGDHAVLPGMPRAHHELAAQPALGQRAALVVARVPDGAEVTLVEEHGDGPTLELDGERNAVRELGPIPEPVPGGHVRTPKGAA